MKSGGEAETDGMKVIIASMLNYVNEQINERKLVHKSFYSVEL